MDLEATTHITHTDLEVIAVLAYDYPLLNLFWTLLMLFLFVGWIMLVLRVFTDIFRRDSSGWSKALWSILVIAVPPLGVLVYLIAHGDDMVVRDVEAARTQQAAVDTYIRQVAGSTPSTADELEKLASLHQRGVLSDTEFAGQKARLLA